MECGENENRKQESSKAEQTIWMHTTLDPSDKRRLRAPFPLLETSLS